MLDTPGTEPSKLPKATLKSKDLIVKPTTPARLNLIKTELSLEVITALREGEINHFERIIFKI